MGKWQILKYRFRSNSILYKGAIKRNQYGGLYWWNNSNRVISLPYDTDYMYSYMGHKTKIRNYYHPVEQTIYFFLKQCRKYFIKISQCCLILALIYALCCIDLFGYIYNQLKASSLYEEHYVNPQDVAMEWKMDMTYSFLVPTR